MNKKAIVVGAGIVGLATARALATRNYDVMVIERNEKAVGASIRNFGMVWPIGQPDGALFEAALLSRSIWKNISEEANIWHEEAGSLHLANNKEEWDVLQQLATAYQHRGYELLNAEQTIEKSKAVLNNNLFGSLYSKDELIVDPRKAIPAVAQWLSEKHNVQFIWNTAVTKITHPKVYADKQVWEADLVFVCSGADFETLYPEQFAATGITKCKLQMMRMKAQPNNQRIGPALCGGLSLVHYNSFKAASSLQTLKDKYEIEYPEYLKLGIHVMVSQNAEGELTVGDSHEYGLTHDPFNRQHINNLILDYLKTFAQFADETVIETWNGFYAKLTKGETNLIVEPKPGVTIINGLGGAGMTLSFGTCDNIIKERFSTS